MNRNLLPVLIALLASFAPDVHAKDDVRRGIGAGTDSVIVGMEFAKEKDGLLRLSRLGTTFSGGIGGSMDWLGKTSPFVTTEAFSVTALIGGGLGGVVYPELIEYAPATLYAAPVLGSTMELEAVPIDISLAYRITPFATLTSAGPVTGVSWLGISAHVHIYF